MPRAILERGNKTVTNEEIQERFDLVISLENAEKRLEDSSLSMTNDEIRERLELVNSLLEAEEKLAEV
jgi:hypothetical protein